jgi:hypothetical protein
MVVSGVSRDSEDRGKRPDPRRSGRTGGLAARAHRRYLDILASVYIYNEHRG